MKEAEFISKHKARPVDLPSAAALEDSTYHAMLNAYGDRIGELTEPIWKKRLSGKGVTIAPPSPFPLPLKGARVKI